MPGIEPGPLGCHTSALTNELQEVMFGRILYRVFIFKGKETSQSEEFQKLFKLESFCVRKYLFLFADLLFIPVIKDSGGVWKNTR